MTFPSPLPPSQNSASSSTARRPSVQLLRTQQSAWGLPNTTTSAGRGLTPLSTDLGPSTLDTSNRPLRTASSASPFTHSFSSVVNPSGNVNQPRTSSSITSPSISSFPPLQSGGHQVPASLSSPRSRAATPASQPALGSFTAPIVNTSQAGGSSTGGGLSRSQTFSPAGPSGNLKSPISATFERSPQIGSNTFPNVAGSTAIVKIVITQLYLLLGSITEKEGKEKWESQAESVYKVK